MLLLPVNNRPLVIEMTFMGISDAKGHARNADKG
jgi:hypothetical protein